jgi:poly(hydroxyalkanoate) depolymerase family esterase
LKPLHAYVTGAIERALSAAGLHGARRRAGSAPAPASATPLPVDVAATIERALSAAGLAPAAGTAQAFDARTAPAAPVAALPALAPAPPRATPPQPAQHPAAVPRTPRTVEPASRGEHAQPRGVSLRRSFGNASGHRDYTLYVPAARAVDTPRPLLLMLHGCTQDPDDFARGTAMNALADAHGLLVAYPEQPRRDNGSRCWNWFRRQDQQRDSGEASILAGIVGHVAADHRVDMRRVYVAGLSAGAAMAVILGRTHPQLFAAVGAHSGLPFAVAQDVPGAFRAMQGHAPRTAPTPGEPMPTIVFHGSADRTVDARNGQAIVHDALAGTGLHAQPHVADTDTHTCTRYVDADGASQVEHWLLKGQGHAWSGGDPAGSHVDPSGPGASAQMLRFFLQHSRAA